MKRYLLVLHLILYTFFFFFSSCEKDPPVPPPPVPLPEPIYGQYNYGSDTEDNGYGIAEDASGNFYMVGSTAATPAAISLKQGLLIKTDSAGTMLWSREYGGAGTDLFSEIIPTTDGNFLMIGTTTSFPLGSASQAYMVKVDPNGDMIWEKVFGDVSLDYMEDVIETSDGGYLLVGIGYKPMASSADISVLKLNAAGDSLWGKKYGASGHDGAASVALDPSGNAMVLCYTDNFGAVNRDLYLMKLNVNGDSIGAWLYGSPEYEEAQDIQYCSDGNFILCGHTAGFGDPYHNAYLLKVDPNGGLIWQNNYGGPGHQGGEHVVQTSDGGFAITGRSILSSELSQVFLFKISATGSFQWERKFGNSKTEVSTNMIQNANFYMMVGSANYDTNGNNDVFLVKTPK